MNYVLFLGDITDILSINVREIWKKHLKKHLDVEVNKGELGSQELKTARKLRT